MGLFDVFASKKVKQERKAQEAEMLKLAQEIGLYKDTTHERESQTDLNPDDFSLDIYEKMLTDGQVRAAVEMIMLSATAKGFTLTGEDAESRKIADFILDNFESIDGNMEDAIKEILTAIVYGYSCTEKVFEYKDGAVRLKKLKTLDPKHVEVKTDKFGDIVYAEQRIGSKVIKLPPEKIIWYPFDKNFGNMYGRSVLRPVYKHWLTKDRLYRFANIAYERYGTPLLVGTTTDANDVGKMNKILSRINSMTSLSISGGDKVEAIQMTNADFIGYIEHHDRKIMESMLVPPMLLGLSRGQSGSYALSGNQSDVFLRRLEAIQRNVKSLIEEEIIRPLADYNFPNVKRYPSFSFKPLTDKDMEKLAIVLEKLINLNVVAPEEDWIREEFGFPATSKEMKSILDKKRDLLTQELENAVNPPEPTPAPVDPNAEPTEGENPPAEGNEVICTICGAKFTSAKGLSNHMRSAHKGAPKK